MPNREQRRREARTKPTRLHAHPTVAADTAGRALAAELVLAGDDEERQGASVAAIWERADLDDSETATALNRALFELCIYLHSVVKRCGPEVADALREVARDVVDEGKR